MSKSRFKLFSVLIASLFVLGISNSNLYAAQATPKAKNSNSAAGSSSSGAKLDLNTASEKDLVELPGVGAATAKKIIAGRPYSSVDGLSKAGVSASTISKISSLVTVGGAPAAPAAVAKTSPPPGPPVSQPASAASSQRMPAAGAKVDLNSASEKDLVDLPGVGPATAKKIIAGRPYSSVDGLSKSGVSASTIGKISSLVTVSGAPAAPAAAAKTSPSPAPPVSQPASAASSQPTPAAPPARTPAKPATTTAAQGSPGAGMVWVNVDSGVYHYQGSRYYGTTKTGKYMSESDALAAGYHAAKNEKKPQ